MSLWEISEIIKLYSINLHEKETLLYKPARFSLWRYWKYKRHAKCKQRIIKERDQQNIRHIITMNKQKKAAVIQTLPVDWTPLNMQKYTMTQVTMRRPKSSQRIPPASLMPFVFSRSLRLGEGMKKNFFKKLLQIIYIILHIDQNTTWNTPHDFSEGAFLHWI